MILNACLWCLSVVNQLRIDILKTIILSKDGDRKTQIESVVQDDYWLAHLRKGTYRSKEEGFNEVYVLKIGETLQKYSKDWSSYYDFATKASAHAANREVEVGDYRDILAAMRAYSLKHEKNFNKEHAHEMMLMIYHAMENRLNA